MPIMYDVIDVIGSKFEALRLRQLNNDAASVVLLPMKRPMPEMTSHDFALDRTKRPNIFRPVVNYRAAQG